MNEKRGIQGLPDFAYFCKTTVENEMSEFGMPPLALVNVDVTAAIAEYHPYVVQTSVQYTLFQTDSGTPLVLRHNIVLPKIILAEGILNSWIKMNYVS